MKINNISFTGNFLPPKTSAVLRNVIEQMDSRKIHYGKGGIVEDCDFLTAVELIEQNKNWDVLIDIRRYENPIDHVDCDKIGIVYHEPKTQVIVDTKTDEIISIQPPSNEPIEKVYERITNFLQKLNENFGNPDVVKKNYRNPFKKWLDFVKN